MSNSNSKPNDWSHWHDRLHKRLIANKDLLPKGSLLLLSVSGGQDSMALTKLLLDLKRIYKWNLHIWHGDHGWHPNSKIIAKELKNWCSTNQLNFYSNKTNKRSVSKESDAREWRYLNLLKTAELISSNKKTCNHILTAHTGSDRAETFLLNLARGADLQGLSTLKESRPLYKQSILIRPLLSFSREDTSQICKEMNIPVWLDPSNESIEFSRNKIRHKVLPILEELHPGCSIRIASLAERLAHYKSDQRSMASLILEKHRGDKTLCRTTLKQLPMHARGTLLSIWIKEETGHSISARQIETLSIKIASNQSSKNIDLSFGWQIYLYKDAIKILPPS